MMPSGIVSQIPQIVRGLSENYLSYRSHSLEWRKHQISQIKKCIQNNKAELIDAFKKDLRQSDMVIEIECNFCISECDYFIKNLDSLSKPNDLSVSLAFAPAYAQLIPEPHGIVLIFSCWNYPLQLSLLPLIGAIAAGNAVLLKPSEISPSVSHWIGKYLGEYLDNSLVQIIEGGVEESRALLNERWDYIFYTGSPEIGKVVSSAAANNLTPCTLELGGKCPTIIDETVDLDLTVKRLVWGKFLNCGQTCIAPDYLYLHESMLESFLIKFQKVCKDFYSQDPQNSPDYSRIVNAKHFNRLNELIDENKEHIKIGGKVDLQDKYIEPTVVLNPKFSSRILNEEIFGPILPVITYTDLESIFKDLLDRGEKPLALYVFSNNPKTIERFTKSTSSGCISVNETVFHASNRDIPFGGVGRSGHGRYYGKYSFETFSHLKPIFRRYQIADFDVRFPPYTPKKISTILYSLKYKTPRMRSLLNLLIVALTIHFSMNYTSMSLKIIEGLKSVMKYFRFNKNN